ncbi:Transmembrane protein 205-like Protein [Tribolium castaneum]|uniref:Transmembrane protein 205-like Protein n=1 Tax=Tribolium castaneum TaxID=7070 RepID=D6W805_TRICA|nr:PREDICTED: transmembrane protein 205 [Tribolium castaneum]EFA11018.1 Transmembrane protein 205-like Protein [Tribolium castaneum]|eukprot:XP_970566.1 PREDICTED: transmembrane protein 205 [Tribolium castaneum]
MCVGKVTSGKLQGPFGPPKTVKLVNESGKVPYQEDILALSTYYTKVVLFTLDKWLKSFQDSICYKILFHTTQPAHVITALAVIMVSLMLIPSERKASLESPLWSFIYMGSFSAHFGAQIWMTFISGLSLYFALPRHTFGNIQKVLFPKYFLLNSILSLITLYVFLRAHNYHLKSTEIAVQVGAMTLCFLIELLIRLYLTPPLLKLMTMKNRIEAQAGVGMEIGKLVPGNLLNCPHYMAIHKAFRRVHMTIAIGNLVTMACTMLHLYYLSQKLCVL